MLQLVILLTAIELAHIGPKQDLSHDLKHHFPTDLVYICSQSMKRNKMLRTIRRSF